MGLCVSFIAVALHELGRLPSLFVVCSAIGVANVMNPVLQRLWVEQYTGNANFVLATTIVHALALTTLMVRTVVAVSAAFA